MKNTGVITHMNITKYPLVKNIYKNYKHENVNRQHKVDKI